MNKILLARYRALLMQSASIKHYLEVKTLAWVESYCNSILSTPSSDALGINQSVELMTKPILTTHSTSYGINQPIEQKSNLALESLPSNSLKISETCNATFESVAVLWCQQIFRPINEFHGLEGYFDLKSAPADNLTPKDDKVSLEYNVAMISQPVLRNEVIEIVDEHIAVMKPNSVLCNETLEVENDSVAIMKPQYTLRNETLEVENGSVAVVTTEEPLPVEIGNIVLEHNVGLRERTAIRGGINAYAKPIADAIITSQQPLPQGYGEISNDSTAVLSDYLPKDKIGTASEVQHNSIAILSDYTPIDKIGTAEEASLYSKAQIKANKTNPLKNVANTLVESFARATLSTIPAWEYPVLNNGMLKITQAYSITKNNNVLEVG